MKLVVCEKNIAARRIAYILSGGKSKNIRIGRTQVYQFDRDGELWQVVGLRGHIINLDYPASFNKWNKIEPSELINVEPVKKVSEKDIAASLKTLVDKTPYLIVATDFDREGELIGVEIVDLVKGYNKSVKNIKRAKFSAITGYEIKKAFDELTDVDYNLANAGESRQVIDLIWGAVLTRFISITSNRFGKDFLSIGRVQSPTLALLVKREKEINSFKPETFWKIIADLNKDIKFSATHTEDRFFDEDKVIKIFDKVKDAKTATVKTVDKKEVKEYPPSPFSTTSFLQSASYLKISASSAMSIAEELYMSGVISYPRTDNTVYPSSLNLKGILEKLSKSSFSKEVAEVQNNGRDYPTRGKKKTTDHPPIHPVGVPTEVLSGEKKKIYELIVRRFLATLAKDALSETVDASFDISGEPFKTKGYRIIEANWKNIYPYIRQTEKPLPELVKDEKIDISKMNLKKDETRPPNRYSQGSLITTMEKLSLGTKSTRHEIITKLNRRKYITLTPLAPTLLAIAVVDALEECDVVKPKMTAVLENDMDLISEGKKTLEETVNESRKMLATVMKELEKDKDKIKTSINAASKQQDTIGKCPKCGKEMLVRFSRMGKRFVGCTGFPDCKNTYPIPQKGYINPSTKPCSECNSPVVRVKAKGKNAWELCINPDCSAKKPTKK